MAIAYDAAQGRNNGTGTSATLVVAGLTGSDRLLMVTVSAEANGTTISSINFAGTAMTQYGSYLDTDDGAQSLSTWYLVNPATSGTVTATLSGSTNWGIWGDSYTGVDQSTPVANTARGGHTPSFITATPVNVTTTSDATGSWHFTMAKEDSAATAITISAGGSRRQVGNAGTVTLAHFDSNAGINNASDNTMTLDWTGGGQRLGYLTGMIRPVAVASATPTRMMMGIGS